MNKECYVSQPLEVEVHQLGDKTDVILRKNIVEVEKTEDGGESYTAYECDEVQVRLCGVVSVEAIQSTFDYYWNIGLGYTEDEAQDNAAVEQGMPTTTERVEALEMAVLEIATAMYGGE